MEYKVIGGSFSLESLERALNNLAAEGWGGQCLPGRQLVEMEMPVDHRPGAHQRLMIPGHAGCAAITAA
jgi:hypothetical protein